MCYVHCTGSAFGHDLACYERSSAIKFSVCCVSVLCSPSPSTSRCARLPAFLAVTHALGEAPRDLLPLGAWDASWLGGLGPRCPSNCLGTNDERYTPAPVPALAPQNYPSPLLLSFPSVQGANALECECNLHFDVCLVCTCVLDVRVTNALLHIPNLS